MNCPKCEGRIGPETLFESLCEKHFDELEPIPVEEIRAAMARGKKLAEAAREASQAATQRAISHAYCRAGRCFHRHGDARCARHRK